MSSDTNELDRFVLNGDLWNICKPYTSNPPVDEQAIINDLITYISQLKGDI
jgi:hypothetical protein